MAANPSEPSTPPTESDEEEVEYGQHTLPDFSSFSKFITNCMGQYPGSVYADHLNEVRQGDSGAGGETSAAGNNAEASKQHEQQGTIPTLPPIIPLRPGGFMAQLTDDELEAMKQRRLKTEQEEREQRLAKRNENCDISMVQQVKTLCKAGITDHVSSTGCATCRAVPNDSLFQHVTKLPLDVPHDDEVACKEIAGRQLHMLRVYHISRNESTSDEQGEPRIELAVMDFTDPAQLTSIEKWSLINDNSFGFEVRMAGGETWLARCMWADAEWPWPHVHFRDLISQMSTYHGPIFQRFIPVNCMYTVASWLEMTRLDEQGYLLLGSIAIQTLNINRENAEQILALSRLSLGGTADQADLLQLMQAGRSKQGEKKMARRLKERENEGKRPYPASP